MTLEIILIVLVSISSYFVGVFKTKNEHNSKQADSVHRANRARDSVVSGDESAISTDVFNRDNRK